jgi:hypothetical protein
MPLQATSGAASYDGFGGGVVAEPNYIESCFSTWLYTGTGAAQTITNGIDLSTKGGMVWIKNRTQASDFLAFDTARGIYNRLLTYDGDAQASQTNTLTAFNTNGFSIGNNGSVSNAPDNFASWTFRKQPKFFDIVTWTGDGTGARTITHNLGSVAGCIINKPTSATGDWFVYHRGNPSPAQDYLLRLNTTLAAASGNAWNNYAPTSTDFQVSSARNVDGVTYVAYLFAHDAGGFGLTGTDNVISCGSFTTDGSGNATVNLGYEPQWLLTKSSSGTSSWMLSDNMRGWVSGAGDYPLYANLTNAEGASTSQTIGDPTATGFTTVLNPSATYIYIAIRRGPMKVPTLGTSVFSTSISSSSLTNITSGFVTDMAMTLDRTSSGVTPFDRAVLDRLRGNFLNSSTATTAAEVSNTSTVSFQQNNGIYLNGGGVYENGYVYQQFQRAPSFMDVVCYTGVDSGDLTLNHNLSVPYEMLIIKRRSGTGNWFVLHSGLTDATKYIRLNTTNGQLNAGVTVRDSTNTTFLAPSGLDVTVSGSTYVAYLFATCAGVSKVGSYTGNGSTQTINCGFTGGARFVMIKASSTTGDWMVSDSARGIVSGNDPYLELNNTNAEVTGEDWLDTNSTGFVVNEVSGSNSNTNGVTYIFLAIA